MNCRAEGQPGVRVRVIAAITERAVIDKILTHLRATHYNGGSSSPDAKRAVIGFDGKLAVMNRDGVVQAKLKGLPPGCGGFAPLGATFATNNALLLRATNNTFVLGL